jgi:hypothetical protein
LTVEPVSKFGGSFLYESGASVAMDHASKFEDAKKSAEEAQTATFTHELGHHLAETVINKTQDGQVNVFKKMIIDPFQADKKKVSTYAATHPKEYFAESFLAYHVSPEKLSPQAKAMVENVMKLAQGLK